MYQIIEFLNKLPKQSQPSCKSLNNFNNAFQDSLAEVKSPFFSFNCSIAEPCLRKFQSNKPMTHFIYTELKSLIKNILQIVIIADVFEKCMSGLEMVKIDLKKIENFHLSDTEIRQELRRNGSITIQQVKKIKEKSQQFILNVLKKYSREVLLNLILLELQLFQILLL